MIPLRCAAIAALLALAGAGCSTPSPSVTRQPQPLVLGAGQDPSIEVRDGVYHYVQSAIDARSILVRRSDSLRGLASATPVTVWRGGEQGTPCCHLWAPEIKYLRGKWYIYFSATNGDNAHRLYAIEAADSQGPYAYKGRLVTPEDRWAIDATVFETPKGELYLLWSGWPGDANVEQNIYLARMTDPWTVTGRRVAISTPSHPWETGGAPPKVNEGPAVLLRGDTVYVTYSASGCWTADYRLGLLRASLHDDLLSPGAWRKSATHVFARNDAAKVFGPGHNGFFRSPDGREDWMVYHAVDASTGDCGGKRTVRAQPIRWSADGTPDFGVPLPLDARQPLPSGDPGP